MADRLRHECRQEVAMMCHPDFEVVAAAACDNLPYFDHSDSGGIASMPPEEPRSDL
jgi:hypothetical protein